MPIRHRIAAGAGVITIAAAIALAGSAPASAHSGAFYTSASLGEGGYGFATISPTDAAVALLPTVAGLEAEAVEIWNEIGYAISGEGDDNDTLYFWDHTTGAVTGSAPLAIDPAWPATTPVLLNVYALDTTKGSTVPDGTILTFAEINTGPEVNVGTWLSSIDPATGYVTPLVDVTGLEDDTFVDSLATDPLTGVTYALVDYNDGLPQYSVLDIAAGTYATPAPLSAVRDSIGSGYMQGSDFTDEGILHFFYSSEGSVFAHLNGAITSNPTATVAGPVDDVETDALAYDPAPKLADTGLNLVNPAIAALAILGLGAAVVVVSRRRIAAA
jgi:hypothetical protein